MNASSLKRVALTTTIVVMAMASLTACANRGWQMGVDGDGYRVQCADGTWSNSGGNSGACSGHGGVGFFEGADIDLEALEAAAEDLALKQEAAAAAASERRLRDLGYEIAGNGVAYHWNDFGCANTAIRCWSISLSSYPDLCAAISFEIAFLDSGKNTLETAHGTATNMYPTTVTSNDQRAEYARLVGASCAP